MRPRAIVFDFNGTLSDDEPLLYEVYAELFAARGRPLSEAAYLDELAGHTEQEIIRRWLGHVSDALVRERISRYVQRARDGHTVDADARAAVHYAAARVPVGVVSSAAREEIEPVLEAAGLAGLLATVVSAQDVERGKPDPEPYELAARRLGLPPPEIVAFEDTEAGVASASAAGLRVVGVTRTLGAGRPAGADRLVARLDVDAVRELVP